MRKVHWVKSSLSDLRSFPQDAQSNLGYGIYLAQVGDKHPLAKPLRHDLAGVMEMVSESTGGNTYRAVYTVKLEPFLYVLHCFEKKSRSGVATPKRHLDLIRSRLKEAKSECEEYWRSSHAKDAS